MALTRGGRTLQLRLVAVTVAVTAVAVVVVALAVQLLLGRTASSDATELLRARTDAVAATVQVSHGRVSVLETPADSLDQGIWTYDTEGRILDGGTVPSSLLPSIQRLRDSGRTATVVVNGSTRLYARPVVADGSDQVIAVVVAGLDLTPYERAESRVLWLTVFFGVVAVLAAGLAAWLASRQSLRLVGQMVRRADDWREHDVTARFALGPPVDEITELGSTLDRMLERIAAALAAERRLTDEVAHELRNPLAVIRSEAQLALLTVGPGQARERELSLRGIVAATEQMDAAIGTMLAVARSAHPLTGQCDIGDVLREVADGAARNRPVEVSVALPPDPLLVAAPSALAVAALSPLVENAVRFARHHVRIAANRDDTHVVVTVSDDGPGVPAADVEDVFHPGRSGPEHDGAGLGLPLARRLAGSVGGRVSARAVGHGEFELVLPAG